MPESRRRAERALVDSLELSARSIRALLFADVFANLFQFEPDSGNSVTPGPEMLPRKVSLFAAQSGDGNRTLSLQKPNHGCDWMLWWDGDAHMHVVRHEMPFDDLASLLFGQGVENSPQLLSYSPINDFPASFGHEHDMVLAVPF